MKSKNTFKTRSILEINGQKYVYFDLNILANYFSFNLNNIPNSIKILLENLIRNEDGESINHEMISLDDISKINKGNDVLVVDEHFINVYQKASEVWEQSEGFFDPFGN